MLRVACLRIMRRWIWSSKSFNIKCRADISEKLELLKNFKNVIERSAGYAERVSEVRRR